MTPAVITEFPMNHHAGTIICGVFFGIAGSEGDGVFGNLGCKAIVCSKGFLIFS